MKLLFSILIFFFPFIGFSQNQYTNSETSDPAALEILDIISNHFSNQTAVQINFSVGFQSDLSETPEYQSGVLYQSGDKYFLAYANQTIVSDGSLLWVYQQDLNEVSIHNVDNNPTEIMLNPSQFLTFYKTMNLSYALIFEGLEEGKQVQKIEFKPLDSNQIVTKLRMTTNKSQKKILRMKAFLKDGTVYSLLLDRYTFNPELESGLFSFNPLDFEGIHIEDLRID